MAESIGYDEIIIGLALNQAPIHDYIESEKIKPEWFDNNVPNVLWRTIVKFYQKRGDLPDLDIIIDIFRGHKKKSSVAAFARRAVKATKKYNVSESKIQHYVDGLRTKHSDVDFRLNLGEGLEILKDQDVDAAKAYLRQALEEEEDPSASIVTIDLVDDWPKLRADLVNRREHPELQQFTPLGFKPFDNALGGGLMPGELMILAAVPSGGKSVGLIDLLISSAETGQAAHFFTIEMTAEQTSYRGYSRLSDVLTKRMRDAKFLTNDDLKRMDEAVYALKHIDGSKVKITGIPEHASTRHMRAVVSKWNRLEGFEPKLILVDYAGIMRPANDAQFKHESDWAFVGQNVRDLKSWALTRPGIPIVSAVQLHPDAIGKDSLTYKDLGLSKILIAAHSDIIAAIVPVTPEEMEFMDEIRIQWLKVREGVENEDGSRIIYTNLSPDFRHIRLHRENQ